MPGESKTTNIKSSLGVMGNSKSFVSPKLTYSGGCREKKIESFNLPEISQIGGQELRRQQILQRAPNRQHHRLLYQ